MATLGARPLLSLTHKDFLPLKKILLTDYKIRTLIIEIRDNPKTCRGKIKTIHNLVVQRWSVLIFWSISLHSFSFRYFFISLCKFSVITTHGHFYITFLPLDLTVSISPYSRSSIFNGQTLFHSAICYNLLTIWVIFNIIHNAVAGFIIGYEGNEAKLYHWVVLR